MGGEEPVYNADTVSDKQAKNQADHAGCRNQPLVEPSQTAAGEGEGNGEGQRHQHHPRDRTETKDQQVENGPSRFANCAQHQQRDRGRSGKTVDDANQQRPQRMKDSQPRERSAQPMGRLDFLGVMFRAGRWRTVGVRMHVRVHSMAVQMGVRASVPRMCGREAMAEPVHGAGQIQNAKQNQHERDRELQREPEARRNDDSEKNNGRAYDQDGQRVSHSPENADPAGTWNRAFTAYDGRYGYHVIRIGCVAHTEKEADTENEQYAGHNGKPFKV